MSKKRRTQRRSAVNIVPGVYPIDSGTAEILPDPYTAGAWLLLINGVQSSQLIPDNPERLGFEYMRWIAIAVAFRFEKSARLRFLHLGGGGATLARWGAHRFPNSRHTAVELDAKLTELARENFGLPRAPIIKLRVGEAGQALAQTRPGSWEIIIRDVFMETASGTHVTPPHLTGVAAARAAAQALGPEGLYVINYGGPPQLGPARAEAAALSEVFLNVALISDASMFKGRRRGNIVMLASHAPLVSEQLGGLAGLQTALRAEPLPTQLKTGGAVVDFIAGTPPSSTPLVVEESS